MAVPYGFGTSFEMEIVPSLFAWHANAKAIPPFSSACTLSECAEPGMVPAL